MADSRIFNSTFKFLANSLDISARRHTLITGNIANMDTIGYKPKDINFGKTLKKAMDDHKFQPMATTDSKHFSGADRPDFAGEGKISYDVDQEHLDSVNIDTEMGHLVENNIKYRETAAMLSKKMGMLRNAIQEGN